MKAGGLYEYLDPGNYNLAASVTKRLDATFELIVGGQAVNLDGGKAYLARENNYYWVSMELTSGEDVYKCNLMAKSIGFRMESHSSLSSGGKGTVKKDLYVSSSIMGKKVPYTIYLPQGYDGTKEYPILYLLHGAMDYGQGHNKWYLDYNSANPWGSGAVQNNEISKLPGITLEMGSSDGTVPPSTNAQFIKFLKDNKVPCEYITRGGGHDWTFWNGCAPKIIAKVGAIFAHNE